MGKEKKDTSLYSKDTGFSHSKPEFDLYTGNFQKTIHNLKSMYNTMANLKCDLDDMEMRLLASWEGEGRNTFQKKYRVVLQTLKDINADMQKIADEILDAENAYLEADMKCAKSTEGVQHRF